jgi:hypothetical protein
MLDGRKVLAAPAVSVLGTVANGRRSGHGNLG